MIAFHIKKNNFVFREFQLAGTGGSIIIEPYFNKVKSVHSVHSNLYILII